MGNSSGSKNKKVEESRSSASVEYPSVCSSASFRESVGTVASKSSEPFTWEHMKNLYTVQENLTVKSFTPSVLKSAILAIETIKKQEKEIFWNIWNGSVKMPEPLFDKFESLDYSKVKRIRSTLDNNPPPTSPMVIKRAIVHLAKVIHIHEIVARHFRLKQFDEALHLVRQMSVAHALYGVTPTEFRLMDWFILQYLIKFNMISDEIITNFCIYLNVLSNYKTDFQESQSVNEFHISKKNDRDNKARENYRLLKTWKTRLDTFNIFPTIVENILHEFAQAEEVEIKSVDTEILRERDCCVHFFKKRTKRIIAPDLKNTTGKTSYSFAV